MRTGKMASAASFRTFILNAVIFLSVLVTSFSSYPGRPLHSTATFELAQVESKRDCKPAIHYCFGISASENIAQRESDFSKVFNVQQFHTSQITILVKWVNNRCDGFKTVVRYSGVHVIETSSEEPFSINV